MNRAVTVNIALQITGKIKCLPFASTASVAIFVRFIISVEPHRTGVMSPNGILVAHVNYLFARFVLRGFLIIDHFH